MKLERHLLPQEFDLLLDEETGFGIPQLAAHVRDCPQCASELEQARTVVHQIERVPHLAPSPLFAERVMARVHVFTPWYVAALDAARRLVPRPGPLRSAVAVTAALACVGVSGAALWAATRMDAFLVLIGIAGQQIRQMAVETAATALGSAGTSAIAAAGAQGVIVTVFILLTAAAVAATAIARAARMVRVEDRS